MMPFQGPRLIFLMLVMIFTFSVLVIRLFEFQVTRFTEFSALSADNAIQRLPLPSPRGVIYDRYGRPLALNAAAFNISIIPAELPVEQDDTLQVLNRLAALIDVPATRAAADAAGRFNIRSLDEQVREGEGIAPYRKVVVATDVRPEIAQTILESKRNMPGVYVDAVSVRQYPTGSYTTQIIGYLGPIGEAEANALRETGYNPAFERVGYAGIEAYLEDELAGQRGLLTEIKDVAGLTVRVLERRDPVPGRNVRLTIDLDLQKVAHDILQAQINEINQKEQAEVTRSGVVIALDPRTGEVLAMVSLPTYDNTRFARAIDGDYYLRVAAEPATPLQNHAIQSIYPPGSVWKLLSATAVLNENVIRADSRLFDGGILTVINQFAANDVQTEQDFVCWFRDPGHQQVDMIRAIAWSCDVYFYQVGGGNAAVSPQTLRPGGLGIASLGRYSTAYSIGVDLGIELPAEVSGRVPDPTWKRRNYGESWSTGDTYNATFGQGFVNVTPLQLLVSSAAIAQGGMLYQPTVLHSWVDSEGNELERLPARITRTLRLPTDGTLPVLNMREDMYLQGKNSLVCTCERNSPYRDPQNPLYDPTLPACTDDYMKNYTAIYRPPAPVPGQTPSDQGVALGQGAPQIAYRVNVPYAYKWDGAPFRMCDPNRMRQIEYQNYQPPFIAPEYFTIVQEGMREAVTIIGGTALAAQPQLDFVAVAGKTGTAEYCDEVARPKGLCIPGQWPSHAWYFGYAPYGDDREPEIAIIGFIYNGKEGSGNALPVVKRLMYCYFQYADQRKLASFSGEVEPCRWEEITAAGEVTN
jgi:penicillin-binding protein 2